LAGAAGNLDPREGQMLQKYSFFIGVLALAVAAWAGTHLAHVFEEATGRHIGETAVLSVVALGLFAASRGWRVRRRQL
jgi:hypothetical protein